MTETAAAPSKVHHQQYSRNILPNNFINKTGNVSVEVSPKHRPKQINSEMKVKHVSKHEQEAVAKNVSLVQDILEHQRQLIQQQEENDRLPA